MLKEQAPKLGKKKNGVKRTEVDETQALLFEPKYQQLWQTGQEKENIWVPKLLFHEWKHSILSGDTFFP